MIKANKNPNCEKSIRKKLVPRIMGYFTTKFDALSQEQTKTQNPEPRTQNQ
jgi:hypothetical protein